MAVTTLSLLPEFSTSGAEPLWVEEVLVMVCDSTTSGESVSEVSEGVGVMTMKPSLVGSSGSGSGVGVGSGVSSAPVMEMKMA